MYALATRGPVRQLTLVYLQKHKRILFDLGWILGLPILTLLFCKWINYFLIPFGNGCTDYVTQEHRFVIIEEEGCVSSQKASGLYIILLEVPNVVLPLISGLYYCRKWQLAAKYCSKY